jgi:hypothetical protein
MDVIQKCLEMTGISREREGVRKILVDDLKKKKSGPETGSTQS